MMELQDFSIENKDKDMRSFYQDSKDFSDISSIYKSKFAEHFHFLCNECNRVPFLTFTTKNIIIFECECEKSPRKLSIRKIYDYLYYSREVDLDYEKLKCYRHPEEKYSYYCKNENENYCSKCVDNCIELEHELIELSIDKNTYFKYKYIIEKMKERKNYIDNIDNSYDSENENENINNKYKLISQNENNIINQDLNNNFIIIKKEKKKINIKENEDDILNIINESNNELNEEEYNFINLFTIILNDYKNYPHFNHIKTISNIENFIIISFDSYEEINLKYLIDKENIINNSIEILGEKFIKNNENNCFLIINEKIIDLNSTIKLDDINLLNISTNILDIKLIKKPNKKIYDLSYMFSGISTIIQINFDKFNTENITKMNNMFENCSSLREFPDISNLDTTNVTDISYMFHNCSSIVELPDISKWNTKNVTDTSSMFQNCESLSFLPDISKWKTNKIQKMNNMFQNCRSLENLPKISEWNISSNTDSNNMFLGCSILEENLTIKKPKCYKFLRILKKFIDCIICRFSLFCNAISLIIYFFLIIISFIFGIYPLFNSFFCHQISESLSNPVEHFNLTNSFNLSHIINSYKIKNSKLIEHISKDKEYQIKFINNKLNFTKMNKNIKFEMDLDYFRLYSLLIIVIFFLNVIICCFRIIRCFYSFINFKRIIIILIILFFFNVLSIIIGIFELIIVRKLLKSINHFYIIINKIFQTKIPHNTHNEYLNLKDSKIAVYIDLVFSFISIIKIVLSCKFDFTEKHSLDLNSYDDYLVNANDNYNLDDIY